MKTIDNLQEKLKLYTAHSVNPEKKTTKVRTKLKSSLLSLAPFAAGALMMPGSTMAQCGQGTASFNPSGGAYSDGQLDVDGDGNPDFDFDIGGSILFITPVGTMSLGLFYPAGGGYAASASFVGSGSTVNSSQPNSGWASGGYAAIYPLNEGSSSSAYLPIRSDGGMNYGFIRVELDGVGGYTVNTALTGVATHTNDVIAGDCISLPIELTAFIAEAKGKNVLLKWETASEINNEGFEIQRSMDGVGFHKIGWVKGEGNSHRTVQYQIMDENVSRNTPYYYRLRQIDFDGRESYSDIQKIEIKGEGTSVKIYPNPTKVNDRLTIDINSEIASLGELQFFNISGQQISSIQLDLSRGRNNINIPIEGLAAGSYFAKINLGKEIIYQKIVIAK